MTKRVFQAFADRLRADHEEMSKRYPTSAEPLRMAIYAADIFAQVAAEENPRFDRERFMRACGLR